MPAAPFAWSSNSQPPDGERAEALSPFVLNSEYRCLKSTLSRALVGFLLLACLAPLAHAAKHARPLPARYQHWLNAEVNYIIDSHERKEFLSLTSDAQRDSFIEAFWRVRNPDPGSPTNSYKDEHYRRLAYANEHYGHFGIQDGWRSDRGRIYIILGAPKQIVTYPSARNVRPLEIWFYQSPTPVLPPYFSLLFFKPSIGEDYKLYSPNTDGPAHLVSTLEALNDQDRSLKILRKSLGDEVARTAVTLLPTGPADLDKFEPGLTSDMLLSSIEGLPDNPLTQELLNDRRLRERVTTSIYLGSHEAEISYAAYRDERGRMTLSYLMAMQVADPRLVGTRPSGSSYYDVTLRTNVRTAAGKQVYMQEDRMTGELTAAAAEAARKKRFGAEARLPLAPGTYIVEATLTNNVNQVAIKQQDTVTVPAANPDRIGIAGLLAYGEPAGVPDPQGVLPFSASHMRFAPRGAQNVFIRQGEKLPLVFQLWLNPAAGTSSTDKVRLHYLFGSVAAMRADPTRDDEEIEAGNRDKAGDLVTGHTLDTSALSAGSYQVVISATREGDVHTAYATLNLHVSPSEGFTDLWTAYGPAQEGGEAVDDLKRGLSAEAQGEDAAALGAYRLALTEGSGDMRALLHLAALLQRKGMSTDLAALSQTPALAQAAAPPAVLLAIASALEKNGDPKAAVRLLDGQLKLQPPSAELYAALASACEGSGDSRRAGELRARAASLKP